MSQPSAEHAQVVERLGHSMERYQSYVNAYTHHAMQADMDHLNMTYRQVGVLFQLRAHGVQNISALARAVHLTLPAASHLLERLVQRGLVHRSEDPDNRRQKQVALSEQGLRFLARMEGSVTCAYTRLLRSAPTGVLLDLQGCFQQLDTYLPGTPGEFARQAAKPREASSLPPLSPKDPS